MQIPVLNPKKLDKEKDHFSYEPIEDLSHREKNSGPIKVPVTSVHPSHSAVRQDFGDKFDPAREADERAGNLFDYINWRGDVPMSVDPFNEVDNLLLSALAYAPFYGLIPENGTMTLYSLNIAFWNEYTIADFATGHSAYRCAPILLKRIASSRRYGNVRVTCCSDECNEHDQCQFAAMTFVLEDGTCYIAFRGTDDSIIGWREDLNLSYMSMTRGQEHAVDYMNRIFTGTSQFIRLGGHSKGGNLAVYAGMYCRPEIQDRIREIYTNDGPGFNREITNSDDYRRILPKIIKFMPEDSIVGILLDSGTEPIIVKSTRNGVYQHSPYSWVIKRNRITRASKRSDMSKFIDRTMDDWLDMLDTANRKVFIDVLFEAIDASGARTISEFTEDPKKSCKAFYKTMKNLPSEQRAVLLLVLSKLAKSGTNQIVSGVTGYLSDLTDYLSDLTRKS